MTTQPLSPTAQAIKAATDKLISLPSTCPSHTADLLRAQSWAMDREIVAAAIRELTEQTLPEEAEPTPPYGEPSWNRERRHQRQSLRSEFLAVAAELEGGGMIPLRMIWSFWKDGSGGFGFGVWRSRGYGGDNAIWTVALGPMSVYMRVLNKGER
jgi:hypothetical protein